jgi:menaquinone-dependent protoporphyrinogen oxidase
MVKVLVSYASEHGGTAQIAQTIATVLRQFDLEVSLKRIDDLTNVEGFDAYIIGSAIYVGEWLPEAQEFLKCHQTTLAQMPLWLFSSGPTGQGEAAALLDGALVPPSLESLVESLHPRDIRVFHGKIDLRRLPPKEREIIKAAAVPRGDYRDWEAIKQWATEISRALTVHEISKAPPSSLMTVEN